MAYEIATGTPSLFPSSETGEIEATGATKGMAVNGDTPDEEGTIEFKTSDAEEPGFHDEMDSVAFEPVPTHPIGSEDGTSEPKDKTSRLLSQISLATAELRDRELPPLPDPLPDPAPVTPKPGIPIPILTDHPPSSRHRKPVDRPLTPTTLARTASRNAPTTAGTGKRATNSSTSGDGSTQPTLSSMVFVVQALESILNAKERKRRKPLADSIQRALDAIKSAAPELPPDPAVVFEPLQIACSVQNTQITITALDCIGKLISYSYFSVSTTPPRKPPTSSTAASVDDVPANRRVEPPPPTAPIALIERAIETTCDCFRGDMTSDQVELQIIKALLAAVLNDKAVVHGAGLLKAIRQTYNISFLSRSGPNRMTAQGALTQMVDTVFERVKVRIAMKEANLAHANGENASSTNLAIPIVHPDDRSSHAGDGDAVPGSPDLVVNRAPQEKITLQSFENRKSFDDGRIVDNAPTTVTHTPSKQHPSGSGPAPDGSVVSSGDHDEEDETFVNDAFLVFRAMCRLSTKPVPAEQIADLKSQPMRSKLLSLNLIHTILKSHMTVLVSPFSTIRSSNSAEASSFMHAMEESLCLSLSRNAASAVGLVFEVCCEIFLLMICHMRVMLKVNISTYTITYLMKF